MKNDDLIEKVLETNRIMEKPVDDDLVMAILDRVIKHPLDEDRKKAQDQIQELIKNYRRRPDDNNTDEDC